jgi:hypothetical protein
VDRVALLDELTRLRKILPLHREDPEAVQKDGTPVLVGQSVEQVEALLVQAGCSLVIPKDVE